MSERGMKKWAPYKSLATQYDKLHEMREKKAKVEKPLISSDKAEEINEILTTYNGETLLFTIYENGKIVNVVDTISTIDVLNKKLILSSRKSILFKNILDIQKQ